MSTLSPAVSLRWMIRNQGLPSFVRWAARAVPYHLWLHLTAAGQRELHFDLLRGVSTDGYASREELGLPADSIHYAPIKPTRFSAAMSYVPAIPEEFTFIDIGCGKGRALILARAMGFRDLIGVELSVRLAAIAKCNIGKAEIHNEDALSFRLPERDSVVFMYNPFWRPTMDHFIENLDRSLVAAPRKLYLVYVNPFCMNVVDKSRTLKRTKLATDHFAIYES